MKPAETQATSSGGTRSPAPIRALVLCDDAWHPAEVVQRGLGALADSRFAFEFVTHGSKWSPAVLEDFPLLLVAKANHLCATDPRPWLTAENDWAFQDFVRRGGGLLAVHGGTAGYQTLPHLRQSLGGGLLYHPDQCPVTVEPKAGHPLTTGVNQFTGKDEPYVMLLNAPDADVFLHARSAHGLQPAGWTRAEGRGRVCVLTPGHHVEVWLHPEFQKLLRNGLHWVAKLT